MCFTLNNPLREPLRMPILMKPAYAEPGKPEVSVSSLCVFIAGIKRLVSIKYLDSRFSRYKDKSAREA